MRRFNMTQDIHTDVDSHWRLFLDDDYEKRQCLEGFGFTSWELLERRESEGEIFRRIRAVPKLELPAAVSKILGARFAYTEDSRFDKKTKVWRSHMTPSTLGDRLSSESIVRCEPAGEGRCRRLCDLSVEAKIFGVGGLVEGALEKSIRDGWEKSVVYMNRELARRAAGT
jgi:hypothetical protein